MNTDDIDKKIAEIDDCISGGIREISEDELISYSRWLLKQLKACREENEDLKDADKGRQALGRAFAKHAKVLLKQIKGALKLAENGTIGGDWHKMWVIDQMVRTLTGDGYDKWVKSFRNGEDGPNTYSWDVGVAP